MIVFVLDLVDRNHSQNVTNVVEIHAGVSNRNITFSTFTGNNLLYVVIDRTFVETVPVSYDSDDSIFVLSTRVYVYVRIPLFRKSNKFNE